ncbi:MAG TPA: carbohydrate kinase [Microbacteriaceae bacterium]|jgi:fructokinase|nr:carbohydrate kinase [Microbacteriaceae bacterium]
MTEIPRAVCVIGEALIDIVRTTDATTELPGGSPANVAYGLGLLGVETTFLTHLGDDERGRLIAEHLAGVHLAPGSQTAERTSTAAATIGASGAASYVFDLDWSLPGDAVVPPSRVVHTGSIASFLSPGATTVGALLKDAADATIVTYDPNIRPSIIGKRDDNIGKFEAMASLATVVKLSDEDAAWLYPLLTVDEALRQVLALGPRLAIATLGDAGSILMSRETRVEVPSVPVAVVDTIGAGDTYMASLIFSLLDLDPDAATEDELVTMGRRAAVAAAITVSRAGADLPTLAEVDAALRQP